MKFYDITYDNACDSRNSAVIPSNFYSDRRISLPTSTSILIFIDRRKESLADKTVDGRNGDSGKWAQSRNFAGRVSFYGKTFSDTRRTRAAGRQFRRSTGTAYCESYELRNGNCAPAFRKLPDENIQWPARCSIATDNRIKRRKCGPWERYLPPTSYEINGSLGKKRTKK